MLSMVATRRKAERRSGARVPKARQAPLNSSIRAIRLRISGVILMASERTIVQHYTQLHPFNIRLTQPNATKTGVNGYLPGSALDEIGEQLSRQPDLAVSSRAGTQSIDHPEVHPRHKSVVPGLQRM